MAVIFDADTDLPLDFEVESKFCHVCAQSKCSNDNKFAEWLTNNPHACENTVDLPSSEMERASMKKIYRMSTHHNLIYKHLVSDGDCESYNDVWYTYDLCTHCIPFLQLWHCCEDWLCLACLEKLCEEGRGAWKKWRETWRCNGNQQR